MADLSISLVEAVVVRDYLTLESLLGVVTPQWKSYGQAGFGLCIDWDCGLGNLLIPDKVVPGYGQPGLVSHAEVNPGIEAPTDNYDVGLVTREGTDLFGGNLDNRDTVDSEFVAPSVAGVFYDGGDLTFTLSGNSVLDAAGRVVIYFRRTN